MKRKYLALFGALFSIVMLFSLTSTQAQTTADDYEAPIADTTIILNDNNTVVNGNGVTVTDNIILISAVGTYDLSGTLSDGQVIVDTDDDGVVTLILNNVNISSSTTAPIYIKNAEMAGIFLPRGTENYVSDAAIYVYENVEDDEPNATVFSDDDLIMYGAGSLNVTANFNDGIASKDSLTIWDGTITVTSVDDGIRGKDYLVIDGANITLNVQGDGLKSDNDEDVALGYINIISGEFTITANGDAIQAETTLTIIDGTVNISAGGGNNAYIDENLSAKGLKAGVAIILNDGTYNLNTADDAIHANDTIVINAGTFTIATGDDAIHADASIEINGGIINIIASYEGIESIVITINDGDIHIVSSDDGLNVAGGVDGSGGFGGQTSDDYLGTINGGTLVINAEGDGLDANGSLVMTGGLVIINGPTQDMNGALDYDGSFQITGGVLIAAGSSGMLQSPDTTSTQYSLGLGFDSALEAGTLVSIQDSVGNIVLAFTPTKTYQAIVFSSPELIGGETYTIYQGGIAVGTVADGLFTDATINNATAYTSLTLSSITTQEGGGRNGTRGGGPGGGGGRP